MKPETSLNSSKLMRGVRAQQEFELHPNRMVIADIVTMVVIVLQTNLGELTGIVGQVRRKTPAQCALGVQAKHPFISFLVAAEPITAQRRDPSFSDGIGEL